VLDAPSVSVNPTPGTTVADMGEGTWGDRIKIVDWAVMLGHAIAGVVPAVIWAVRLMRLGVWDTVLLRPVPRRSRVWAGSRRAWRVKSGVR